METRKIVGIIIALIVLIFVAYYYLTPKTALDVTILSKEIKSTAKDPMFVAKVMLRNDSSTGEIAVVGSTQGSNKVLWSSLAEGNNYTLSCINMLGTWNCDKVIR